MKLKILSLFFVFSMFFVAALCDCQIVSAEWYIETVSSSGYPDSSIKYTSIALDTNNNRHIIYLDYWFELPTTYYGIVYSYFDCMWDTETINSTSCLSLGCSAGITRSSLALDSNNNPHISYYSRVCSYPFPPEGICFMVHAYHDGYSWNSELIKNYGGGCACGFTYVGSPSLYIDSNDNPHVSYRFANDLHYAYYDGYWHIATVDSGGDLGSNTSLAVDSSNHPHIIYYDITSLDLKHAFYDGAWNIEVLASNSSEGSLILDSYDNPHISYFDVTNSDLRYARYEGNSWHIETVDSEGDVGTSNALAVDSSNHPHIGYYDSTNGDLKYAYHDGNSWHIETVDSEGDVGRKTFLTLDSNNIPHIHYYDNSNGKLKYAHLACPYDFDCDGFVTEEDNCPDIANPCQEDTYPPQGNEIGDACDCEGNFDCDEDCDGSDAATFKIDFGRSSFNNPCEGGDLCNGDFDCDNDCDGTDAALFKQDFGRSQYNDPCPACETGMWCLYEGDPFIKDYSDTGCLGGSSQSSSDQEGICANEDRVTAGVMGNSIIVASSIYGNCCSGIEVELTVDGNDLHLFMMENPPGTCFCNCCFGVETELAGLAADEYTIEMCWYDWGSGYSCETETVLVP